MRIARRTGAWAAALGLAWVALVAPAGANHVTFWWGASPATTNAHSTLVVTADFDGDEPAALTIHMPPGWLFSHQVATPATPLSPIPHDEESIGSGTATALWLHTLCDRNRDLALSVTWEATIDGAAPAGTVAQWTITATVFDIQMYVVLHDDHYDLVIPDMPDEFVCSSTTDSSLTLQIDGTTAAGRKVHRNPATAGSYTATLVYTDTNNGIHTASATVTIT